MTQKLRQCVSQCACNLHGRAFAYSELDCCDFAEIVCFGFGFSNILLCTYAVAIIFQSVCIWLYTLPGLLQEMTTKQKKQKCFFSLCRISLSYGSVLVSALPFAHFMVSIYNLLCISYIVVIDLILRKLFSWCIILSVILIDYCLCRVRIIRIRHRICIRVSLFVCPRNV